ncbi:MAG TPA: TonB-dependent receptor [Gemmatimonas sp.]|uniref:TonB-dependent receptor n=1 Tax=Gemmatimonas sp. TaxID=1962908 RepID=UPI002ED82663
MGATTVILSIVPLALLHADEPTCVARLVSDDRTALWAPPLDRIVNVRLADLSLRDALDRVAAIAKVELSYSNDLLPDDRRVCLSLDRVPVGAVIESLLSGSTLRPIVLGTTQVVLAPTRERAVAVESAVIPRRASVLDRVVVTGSPDGAAQRGSPFALDVVDGATLAQHGATTLGEALDLAVPGIWTWTASAGSVSARYGSIRGASSFGVTAPKIYLDGIEVANPLLVTQLDPSRVARVEVIRGPQGAALYGADAISGVVNILTRHDGTATGAPQLQLSTAAGVSATAYAPRNAFVQDHAISFRAGTPARSVGLGLNVGTIGAYVPGASEQRLLADADGRLARSRSVFTGTARLSLQRANASNGLINPLGGGFGGEFGASAGTSGLLDVGPRRTSVTPPLSVNTTPPLDSGMQHGTIGDSASGQRLMQYTVGGSASYMPDLHWTHSFIVGVDGFRLQGLSVSSVPTTMNGAPSSTAGAGESTGDRGTLRWRSVGRFDVAPQTLLTMTFAGEQSVTRELLSTTEAALKQPYEANAAVIGIARTPSRMIAEQSWYGSSGVSAQGMLAWHDRLFASAGLRAERTTGATLNTQNALLPMLGLAYVEDIGNTVLKFRGAFGRGIRPARSLMRTSSWMSAGQLQAMTSLQPESQQGTEFGADLLIGSRYGLHVTRFDQRASGLIQPVAQVQTTVGANGRMQRTMVYSLQNVGAITNRGWELEGSTRLQKLSLAATMSLVDSRVARLARGYRGELREGDRMFDVPANTVSLSASYVMGRFTLASSATRAADWVGYDRARIGSELNGGGAASQGFEGGMLRNYWTSYDPITRWRANLTYRLRGDLSIVTGGDNLLNVQRGAPDNATVTAGRTLTFGLRTIF